MTKQKIINTSGTRKRAVARVTLKPGKGLVRVNKQSLDSFGNSLIRMRIREPLLLVGDIANQIHLDINVFGGGINSQADAIRAAIGRALSQYGGEKTRKVLHEYDRTFLVCDTRRKEVCKPNDSKARAKRQKSYR